MKKILSILLFSTLLFSLQGCGGSSKQREDHKFVGTFEDEFGNTFTLKEDMTTSITFKGAQEFKGTWSDGDTHTRPYATIEYNGDKTYYYLRDGSLYRYKQDMEEGRCKIKIVYKD